MTSLTSGSPPSSDPRTDVASGRAMERTGDVVGAAAAYQRALRADRNHGPAWVGLGRSLAGMGRSGDAHRALSKGVALDSQSWRDAIPAYEDILRIESANASILTAYANGLLFLQRPTEAIQPVLRLLCLQPSNFEVLALAGRTFSMLYSWLDAIAMFDYALSFEPRNAAIAGRLGFALYQIGYLDRAMSMIHRAIAQQPDPGQLLTLGRILHARGDLELACNRMEWSLSLSGGSVEVVEFLATLYLMAGRVQDGFRLNAISAQQRGKMAMPDDVLRAKAKSIWVAGLEGDFGSQIYHMCFAAALSSRLRVTLFCNDRISPFLARCMPQCQFGRPSQFRVPDSAGAARLSIRTLPYLAEALDLMPDGQPFLAALAEKREAVRRRLRDALGGRMIIGLTWRSSLLKKSTSFAVSEKDALIDLRHSIDGSFLAGPSIWRKHVPLSNFKKLLMQPNIAVVSLQPGLSPVERAGMHAAGIPIHMDVTDFAGDFEDIAALIAEVDAYVGISSTHAHLAAAMGRRTFVLLHEESHAAWEVNQRRRLYEKVTLIRRQSVLAGAGTYSAKSGTYSAKYGADWSAEIGDIVRQIEWG